MIQVKKKRKRKKIKSDDGKKYESNTKVNMYFNHHFWLDTIFFMHYCCSHPHNFVFHYYHREKRGAWRLRNGKNWKTPPKNIFVKTGKKSTVLKITIEQLDTVEICTFAPKKIHSAPRTHRLLAGQRARASCRDIIAPIIASQKTPPPLQPFRAKPRSGVNRSDPLSLSLCVHVRW
jgi:hypothetical protein